MSIKIMTQAFDVQVGNANRKLVLIKLADNANDDGVCWPSYSTIARQCEMGKSTVVAHIKALEKDGFLVIQPRKKDDGQQRSNAYKLTLDNGKPSERKKPVRPNRKNKSDAGVSKSDTDISTADIGGISTAGTGISTAGTGISTAGTGGVSTVDTRTFKSFESTNEPVNEPFAPGDKSPAAHSNVVSIAGRQIELPAEYLGPRDTAKKTTRTWINYAVSYQRRYESWPIWNARVAGQIGQLIDRVGEELAPVVATYYVRSNNQYYVNKGHAVGAMLADAETLATQARTGHGMTAARARQIDSTQTNADAAEEVKRMLAMDAAAEGWE